jgi:hypothetical protein
VGFKLLHLEFDGVHDHRVSEWRHESSNLAIRNLSLTHRMSPLENYCMSKYHEKYGVDIEKYGVDVYTHERRGGREAGGGGGGFIHIECIR